LLGGNGGHDRWPPALGEKKDRIRATSGAIYTSLGPSSYVAPPPDLLGHDVVPSGRSSRFGARLISSTQD